MEKKCNIRTKYRKRVCSNIICSNMITFYKLQRNEVMDKLKIFVHQ